MATDILDWSNLTDIHCILDSQLALFYVKGKPLEGVFACLLVRGKVWQCYLILTYIWHCHKCLNPFTIYSGFGDSRPQDGQRHVFPTCWGHRQRSQIGSSQGQKHEILSSQGKEFHTLLCHSFLLILQFTTLLPHFRSHCASQPVWCLKGKTNFRILSR